MSTRQATGLSSAAAGNLATRLRQHVLSRGYIYVQIVGMYYLALGAFLAGVTIEVPTPFQILKLCSAVGMVLGGAATVILVALDYGPRKS